MRHAIGSSSLAGTYQSGSIHEIQRLQDRTIPRLTSKGRENAISVTLRTGVGWAPGEYRIRASSMPARPDQDEDETSLTRTGRVLKVILMEPESVIEVDLRATP